MTELVHSPAQIISQLLTDLSLADSSWPAYYTNEPADPDTVLTVYNTLGVNQRTMPEGVIYSKRGIQIRARARTAAEGWAKLDAVRGTLSQGINKPTINISGTAYTVHGITRIGEIIDVGKESPTSNRHILTLNFVASVWAL